MIEKIKAVVCIVIYYATFKKKCFNYCKYCDL